MSEAPFSCQIVPFLDYDFFWITFSGPIGIGRLAKAHKQFLEHPQFKPGIGELLDFSATSIEQVNRADINQIRLYMKDQTDRLCARSVLVVNTQLEFGLMRMMDGMLASEAPVDRALFYSLPEALEWLHPGKSEELLALYPERAQRC